MNQTARALGFLTGFAVLNGFYLVAVFKGLGQLDFMWLYCVAYLALHIANAATNGFGIGDVIYARIEAREFRKYLDKELT